MATQGTSGKKYQRNGVLRKPCLEPLRGEVGERREEGRGTLGLGAL